MMGERCRNPSSRAPLLTSINATMLGRTRTGRGSELPAQKEIAAKQRSIPGLESFVHTRHRILPEAKGGNTRELWG